MLRNEVHEMGPWVLHNVIDFLRYVGSMALGKCSHLQQSFYDSIFMNSVILQFLLHGSSVNLEAF